MKKAPSFACPAKSITSMPWSAEFYPNTFGHQAARGDLNLRNNPKIARPQTPKTIGAGSGMAICSPQSTSIAFPPDERSARNNVHVPLASVPFNELNSRSQIPTHYQDATGRHPTPAGRKKTGAWRQNILPNQFLHYETSPVIACAVISSHSNSYSYQGFHFG